MTEYDHNINDNMETHADEEVVPEKVIKIPVKPQRFTPPIHENKFS